jgi:MSHA biogenesis protein MshI
MKININLYDEELRPKKHWLTLSNIAIVCAVCLIGVGISFGMLYSEIQEHSAKLAVVQQDINFAQQELTNLQQALIKHNDNASLNSQKEKLSKRVLAKQALLNLVEGQMDDTDINYYLVMKELTEHHDHNIWLTQFNFNQNTVTFDGYALESKSVTQWMSYLQATQSFKGREFQRLNIRELGGEALQFHTSTSLSEQEVRR